MNAKHTAKTPSPATGLFGNLVAALRAKGSSAPSAGRAALAFATVVLALALPASSLAATPFGITEFDTTFTEAPPAGSPAGTTGAADFLAGTHPFELGVSFTIPLEGSEGTYALSAPPKDLEVTQIAGLIGNPYAASRCSQADFLTITLNPEHTAAPLCPDSAAVGVVGNELVAPDTGLNQPLWSAVFNLVPPPGTVAEFGFWVNQNPVTITFTLGESPPYPILAHVRNISQLVEVGGSRFILWGTPADPVHDPIRGGCVYGKGPLPSSGGKCAAGLGQVPLLTLPPACNGPLPTSYAADSWEHPGARLPGGQPDLADPNWITGQALSHDSSEPPSPQGMIGCSKLGFSPETTAKPTSEAATSPTGLDFSLDQAHNEGLVSPNEGALADALVEKAVVTLPEGMSVNPSQAEGLEVCTEAQLTEMTAYTGAGVGCPQASKIGTVEAETPVLEGKLLKGSLFIARPYENPFGSLIALYIVIQNPELGIKVIQPLKVENDPQTGQITTVAEEIIPQPVSHFRLHFREGTRSPLATPPGCGTYTVHSMLYPSSGAPPVASPTSFQIISGPNGGPCPSGGRPPFHPELQAGTLNNAAGRFSPFNVKLTRTDSEQEITHFSIKLPPGIAGKLAGIPFCSDAAIAKATARTGPHGGAEELADPSCPAASQVGRTLAGAGVGPSLAYAPGKLYLAGPYHGHPVSIVSITSGVVGPFDIGTVVVRLAVDVNPETGEVFLDSTGSDPIPHIIKGIPVHLRDIRAYTDRPEFTFNPTSCVRTSTASTVLGSGLDFVSEADNNPFTATSPFQAADCAALPFAPKLSLSLIGGTKRGDFPKLRAFLRMNGFGEAGIARAQVTLPKSEFIANAHFNTICTRVQFKEAGGNGENCPAGSVYGWARAKTPVLSEPLEGPVYLRSSEHQLPDVVASLRGAEINVHLVGHVDSVKGQLRNTFESVPDAPVEWASFAFQGGKKGLFENSTNLCAGQHKALVKFSGHNGKASNYKSALKVKCARKRKHKKHP